MIKLIQLTVFAYTIVVVSVQKIMDRFKDES